MSRKKITKRNLSLFSPGSVFLFLIATLIGWSLPSEAQNLTFKNLTRAGTSLKYRHWNTDKKKITGFNILNYKLVSKNGKKYILRRNQYVKDDGSMFLEKKTWFQPSIHRLVRHEEKDFRNGLSLVDVIDGDYVKTRVSDKDNSREFETRVDTQLALLETLIPALQKTCPKC